jgi:neutral ceramidase
VADLLVGHGVSNLPVPTGTPLGGYVDRAGGSTGTLDALQVAAVSVHVGHSTAVLCVADVVAVNLDVADACRRSVARAANTTPELVWLSATHTHSGPDTGCVPRGTATPAPWTQVISAAAVDAANAAVRSAAPASLTLHHGLLEGVGGQRSGARRRTDVPVSVLCARDPDSGVPLGMFVVLAVHPTVLSAANRQVSADLPGGVRRALADEDLWVVVATGAAGDMSTRPSRREQTPAEVYRLGAEVASQIACLIEQRPDATADPERGIAGTADTLHLKARSRPSERDRSASLGRARDRVEAASGSHDTTLVRDAAVALQGALMSHQAYGEGSPVSCAVARLELAGLDVVGLGGEPFSALGEQLLERSPGGVLLGYTNGYCGYLPTIEAFDSEDYEVLISPVAPGESERALDAAATVS